MKYTPRLPPDDVNVTRTHPLKEFALLVGGFLGIGLGILVVLAFSADRLITFIPLQYENTTLAEIFGEADVSNSYPQTEAYLDDLLQRLHQSYTGEDKDAFEFQVRVIAEPEPNAFVTPGGRIRITTGLLQMMQTENGLAMVLSHEMGHQYKRHPLRGLGRGVVVGLALLVMTGLDGGNWASSLISDTTMLGNLAYSRSQEAEADHIGVQLLSKTFGHAAGASEFFHLIQQRGLTMDAMAFFSAHPSTSSRIRELEQFETRLPGSVIPLPSFIKQETAGSETASGS